MFSRDKLQVEAIRKGTVIDHIPSGQGIKILKQLQFLNSELRITVGFNLPSKALGLKDIIKVENRILSELEANQLSIFAPNATINFIDDYRVKEKFVLTLPQELTGVFECPNSNCITNNEAVSTSFKVSQYQEQTNLNCKYCEKTFSKDILVGL